MFFHAPPTSTSRSTSAIRPSDRWHTLVGGCASAAALLVTGCPVTTPSAPALETESALVVTSELAPGLKYLSDRPADQVLQQGDVALIKSEGKAFSWRAPLIPDVIATRSGPTVRVQLTPNKLPWYVFRSDVRTQEQVPTRRWICSQLQSANREHCEQGLARKLLPNKSTIAFLSGTGHNPLIKVSHDGRMQITWIDNILNVRLAQYPNRTLALVETEPPHGPNMSGSNMTVIEVSPAFRRLLTFPLTRTDARDLTHVKNLNGHIEVRQHGLLYVGESGVSNAIGPMSRRRTHVAVWYGITPEGQLVPSKLR